MDTWERLNDAFGQVYSSQEEETLRMEIFAQNVAKVLSYFWMMMMTIFLFSTRNITGRASPGLRVSPSSPT